MSQDSVKQKVLAALESLPTDATIDDAMERLYVLAKVQRGLDEAEGGATLAHEEARTSLLR